MNGQPQVRRFVVGTAIAGTVFIAIGAFWLSFTALADLARRSGIDDAQAWAWPLIVDGIIVVATVAVVAFLHLDRGSVGMLVDLDGQHTHDVIMQAH